MPTAYATINGRTYYDTDFLGTAYVDGLPDLMGDFVLHAANTYKDASSSSNSIGSGTKTFTVSSNKPYDVGTPLRISDVANPTTKYLDCIVTSYGGTTLQVSVVGYAGSGTISNWNINIGGSGVSVGGTLAVAQGGTGATTASAALDSLGAQPRTRTILDKTSNHVVLSAENGTLFTNSGSTVSLGFTLPATAKGLNYGFYAAENQILSIACLAGSFIRNGLISSGSGGNISCLAQKGSFVKLIAVSTTEWVVEYMAGNWDIT